MSEKTLEDHKLREEKRREEKPGIIIWNIA
jgi:hypothetical protein